MGVEVSLLDIVGCTLEGSCLVMELARLSLVL